MEHMKYWSQETNPESGLWFEYQKACLEAAQNGKADIDALIDSEYGALMTEGYLRRRRFDRPSKEAAEYLDSFGLRKELHDDGNYYSSWCICLPKDIPNDSKKKYPTIIANSFNVGTAEFDFDLYQIAARERFLYMSAQNTNWDSISALIDKAAALYPIDLERVYITGFSYTGYQSTGAFTHVPWKFAGAAPCGNDIFRPADHFDVPYAPDELARLRHFVVPFMQVVGACEASNFVPLNDWHIRAHWGNPKPPEGLEPPYRDPRAKSILSPTVNPVTRLPDGSTQNTPPSAMPHPPRGMDRHIWMLDRLNRRLDLLRCEERDIDKCLAYLDTPEDELHHVLGFYGDRERIDTLLGLKHYRIDIDNRDGLNVFRYVAVENHPHKPPLTMAELIWDFFRQFRRDHATGRLIADRYEG